MNSTACDICGADLRIGDYPFCKGNPANHQRGSGIAVPDDIPGGVLIENGLCHADGRPRRFYSRSEIERAAKEQGLVNMVRHVPASKDSDKSPHTIDWSKGSIDPQTLENVRVLLSRPTIILIVGSRDLAR